MRICEECDKRNRHGVIKEYSVENFCSQNGAEVEADG